jgi:hypothetical protein
MEETVLQEIGVTLRELVRQEIWGQMRNNFDMAYGRWKVLNEHRLTNWMFAALGALDTSVSLPQTTRVKRLKFLRNRLDHSLQTAAGLVDFLERLQEFQTGSERFRRQLYVYLGHYAGGAEVTVTALTIVENVSFIAVSILASIISLGAAPAAAGAAGIGEALLGAAARTFVITQMQHQADRLGRTMAGDVVPWSETRDDLYGSAVDTLSSAMLGQLTQRLLPGMSTTLNRVVREELANDQTSREMLLSLTRFRIQSMLN